MPRPNFKGLSKSKDGTWKVHYQHHHSTLQIGISSKPGKYFSIKQDDNGSLTIRYYNKFLSIGAKRFSYSDVLSEICPEFRGDEIEAEIFLTKNINDSRIASLNIYNYCIEHDKPIFKYDMIKIGSELLYCTKSDNNDIENIMDIFCNLVKCSMEDLKTAIIEYIKTDSIIFESEFASENRTARERSIIHHYPK
jgi:hypothetical protein